MDPLALKAIKDRIAALTLHGPFVVEYEDRRERGQWCGAVLDGCVVEMEATG